jgi:hypothetical protein
MPGPNFLIIGAQKSGTTWVSHRLQQHPEVFLVHGTYFFDNPKRFARGVEWYERFFRDGAGKKAIGEKTPSYLWGEKFSPMGSGEPNNVPRRVREILPDVRLIAVLRNPVTRAISHFNHSIRSGKLPPFTDIDRALTGGEPGRTRGLGLLERGLYCDQIQRWLRYFPREQIRILVFERDVIQHPKTCLTGLCSFLGIDPAFEFQTVHSKENQKLCRTELVLKYYAPAMRKALQPILKRLPQDSFRARPETYAFLADYYAGPNECLARELGVNLSCWKKVAAAV